MQQAPQRLSSLCRAAKSNVRMGPGTPSLTHDQARNARARAWAYVFECFSRRNGKQGGPTTAPDDAMKGFKDDRAGRIIPERP
jgi:hypothetical protein